MNLDRGYSRILGHYNEHNTDLAWRFQAMHFSKR